MQETVDPLAEGELALITRDLARQTRAESALLGMWDSHRARVRVVCAVGGAHEKDGLLSPAGGQGFVGRVLETGQAVTETIDPGRDHSFGLTASGDPVRYAAGAPVRPPNGAPGALCIGYAREPPGAGPSLTLWVLERYAGLASLCMYDTGILDGLLASARLDGLTGCLNHSAIRAELVRGIERSSRGGRPLSCCFIDLDHFKQVNDNHGHARGSQVLAEVAALLRAGIRVGDSLGRYGGDEFVAILPDTSELDATALAKRLCATVATTTITGTGEPLGVSIGVAQAHPGASGDELLVAADDALRTAKAGGGGLVVGASDLAARDGRGAANNNNNHRQISSPAADDPAPHGDDAASDDNGG